MGGVEDDEGALTAVPQEQAREAAKLCSEGARRQRHAAVPGVREDRVASLSQSHGVITPRIRMSQSAGAPGAHRGAPWVARGAAAGGVGVAWHHSADIG